MGKVIGNLSMSLDGFVAGPNDGRGNPLGDGGEALLAWYYAGDTALPLPGTDMVFTVSRSSAELLREQWDGIGAMVAGRRMFDIADAWHGDPPGGGPCFIVTHTAPRGWTGEGSPFTFVTDGVESAVAQARAVAGDKNVAVSSASIIQQCLRAGLMDEIHVDLAPVLLGGGVRLFENLGDGSIGLKIKRVVEAPGVTHLHFRVAEED